MNGFVRRTILRYTTMYISIAILVMLMLVPVYRIAYNASRESMTVEIAHDLQASVDALDRAIYSIHLYANGLLTSEEAVRIAYTPDVNHYHLRLALKLLNDLKNQTIRHALIFDDIFLIFANSDYVLLRDGLAKRQDYYGQKLLYDEMTQADYERMIFSERASFLPMQVVRTNYRASAMRAITLNFYGSTVRTTYSAASVIIFEDRIREMMLNTIVEKYGNLLVTDMNGNEYYAYNAGMVNSTSGADFSLTSESGLLHVEAHVREEAFAQSVQPVGYTVVLFCIIAFCTALLLSVIYALRIYRPIRKYLSYLGSERLLAEGEYRSVDSLMNASIHRLTSLHSDMSDAVRQLRTQYHDALLSQIADGAPVNQAEMAREFGNTPIFQGDYLVLRLYIGDEQHNGMPLKQIEQVYERVTRQLLECFDTVCVPRKSNYFAVFPIGGVQAPYASLSTIAMDLAQDGEGEVIRLLVSAPHKGIEALHDAYGETSQLLHIIPGMLDGSALVLRYDQMNMQTTPISIWLFQPMDLYNLLLSGSDENLCAYMERLIDRYAEASVMRPMRANVLYYGIIDVFESALAHIHVGMALREAMPDAQYDDVRAYLIETALTIRHMVDEQEKSTDGNNEILTYIDTNYCRVDLCLSLLAEEFDLSEAHISRLIKAATGCPYSEYVEAKRMKRAIELLNETDMAIGDISAALGYENQSTFFKAFKRTFHIPPGSYRRNQKCV